MKCSMGSGIIRYLKTSIKFSKFRACVSKYVSILYNIHYTLYIIIQYYIRCRNTLYPVYSIHYTLYSVQHPVCRICWYIVQVWTVDPTEIFINAIAIMTPGKSNRQPIQYTV